MTPEQVITHFTEQVRAPDDYLYLLVDGLAECDPEHLLSAPSLTQTFGENAVTRVLRPDLAHSPKVCPALVQLAGPREIASARHLIASARYAMDDIAYNRRYICGWLLSPLPLAAVADHIAEQCRTTSPRPGLSVSPWYEPIRLELLAAALGSRVGDLLTPVRRWLSPTSWGSVALFRGTTPGPSAPLPELARDTQRLAPLITDFLGAWRDALELPMGYAPWRWTGSTALPQHAGTHAFRLIRDAIQHRLTDSRDVITLSLYRVFIHPHLPRHPDIQHDIAEAIATNNSLQSRFNAYDDAQWKHIVASLPRAEQYS